MLVTMYLGLIGVNVLTGEPTSIESPSAPGSLLWLLLVSASSSNSNTPLLDCLAVVSFLYENMITLIRKKNKLFHADSHYSLFCPKAPQVNERI